MEQKFKTSQNLVSQKGKSIRESTARNNEVAAFLLQ